MASSRTSPKRILRLIKVLYFVFSISIFSIFFVRFKVKDGSFIQTTAPAAERTELSHIQFGIGGSVNTWHARRRYSDLWWKPNLTRGFVWLEKEPDPPSSSSSSSPPYRVSGDTAHFAYSCWYGSRSAVRIARIVKESFEMGLPAVRWFVMGDDDTVFFPENLVAVLNKYDHEQMYYIGAESESVRQDVTFSYGMAYGGGGFAVSYPLAAELVRVLDGCINRYASFYGSDEKIHACILQLGVPLTKELGFHQMDIRGSPYGLLMAHPLAPLVSIHHLGYIGNLFPAMTKLNSITKLFKAYKMDPGRTLQQSFCYDLTRNWSISVSWGYAVQLYQSILSPKQIEAAPLTFRPWRGPSDFTFDTRPIKSGPCKDPLLYFFDGAERMGLSKTQTTYTLTTKNECDYGLAMTVKAFNVSAPTLSLNTWHMSLFVSCVYSVLRQLSQVFILVANGPAPRRQYCEILNPKDERQQQVIQVEIRGYHELETTASTASHYTTLSVS